MHVDGALWRPDISSSIVCSGLSRRSKPYWKMVEYGRHVGFARRVGQDFWVARVRTKEGSYFQSRLGRAWGAGGLTFDQAMAAATAWFAKENVKARSASSFPVGVRRNLVVSPIGTVFSIAHAMSDYVEWKRIAAAKTHFATNLSLIVDFRRELTRDFHREVTRL